MWDRAYRNCFTSDSRYIICGGDDKTVGVWNAKTGEEAGRVYVGAGRFLTVKLVVIAAIGVGTVSTGAKGVQIMAGDDLGRVISLELTNFNCGEPFVTPAYVWHIGKQEWTSWYANSHHPYNLISIVLSCVVITPGSCSIVLPLFSISFIRSHQMSLIRMIAPPPGSQPLSLNVMI